jgi:hypothetical protein
MADMYVDTAWKNQTPDSRFYFGLLLLLIAAIQLIIGKTWGRNGQTAGRATSLFTYWVGVGAYVLSGASLIWWWGLGR